MSRPVYQKALKIGFILGSLATIVGCTAVPSANRFPDQWGLSPGQLEHSSSFYAKGYQQFKCAVDDQGYYWQHVKTEANLYSLLSEILLIMTDDVPVSAKLIARSGTKQVFTHVDGSSVRTTRIIYNTPSKNKNNDIPQLFMSAKSSSSGGRAFDSVKTIFRTETEGGMPNRACSASSLGQFHKSTFSAVYTFRK